MPGGGIHMIAPGQITDDSELAICLARGLCNKYIHIYILNFVGECTKSSFDIEKIAK